MNRTPARRQPGEQLWTPKRLAEYLDVSKSSVYAWAADGTVPAIVLSEGEKKRTFRFDPAEILTWIEEKQTYRRKLLDKQNPEL